MFLQSARIKQQQKLAYLYPALASLALLSTALPSARAATAGGVAGIPGAVSRATNHGPVAPATPLRLTVWLAMHNRQEFDQRVAALYTPGSPTYHQWLSPADLLAYAPTPAEHKAVRQQLEQNGLAVTTDPENPFALHVTGTAEKVESAFATQIHSFENSGDTFHANVTQAALPSETAQLVLGVSGLSNLQVKPQSTRAINQQTGKPLISMPLARVQAASNGLASLFTDNCFPAPQAFTFGSARQMPIGVYYGNLYNQGDRQCAYTAAQMQAAYGLPSAYKAGLHGEGQTIVIVVPYGSPTLERDANAFNSLNSLPALDASTLKTIYPGGQPTDPGLGALWVQDASIDVEWSHAFAPAAKIILLAAKSGEDQDVQNAIAYAALHKLGNVLAGSFSIPEIELGSQDLDAYNQVIEQAAAVGIAVNFATGNRSDLGLGTPVGAIGTPSDSPYATAVGGTSIGIPGGTDPAKEVGWGNNETFLAYSPTADNDPPYNYGNVGGSGGGSSLYFAKPAWQSNLPGSYRLAPDIAMDGDPFTGAVLVYTETGSTTGPTIEAIGGTSLAAPMFSAVWALADQKAGHSLGQAAPLLHKLPTNALNDIIPVTSPTDVAGTNITSSGATFYSAASLAAPLQGTSAFVSAIWPIEGEYVNLTFGTDGSLTTAKGWDNVTGYGTPAGLSFITAAAKE